MQEKKKRNDPLRVFAVQDDYRLRYGTTLTSRGFIKHGACKMQSVVYARSSSFIAPLVLSLHSRG